MHTKKWNMKSYLIDSCLNENIIYNKYMTYGLCPINNYKCLICTGDFKTHIQANLAIVIMHIRQ